MVGSAEGSQSDEEAADHGVIVLGLDDEGTSTTSSEVVQRSSSLRAFWLPLVGVLAALAAAFGVWSILTGDGSDAASGEAGAPAADETNPADDGFQGAGEADGGHDEVEAVGDPGFTEGPPGIDPDTVVRRSAGEKGPVLGAPVDYDLVVDSDQGRTVIDLDTGTVLHHDLPRLALVGRSGEWLVFQGGNNLRTAVVPLDDLGAEARYVAGLAGAWRSSDLILPPASTPGQLWFYIWQSERESVVVVDLATGDAVDHPLAALVSDVWVLSPGGWQPIGGEGLYSPAVGGVYRVGVSGPELVLDGRVLVADQTRMLVETCDERLACGSSWYAVDDLAPLDLIGFEEASSDFLYLEPGTDWVLRVDRFRWDAASLINVVTGESRSIQLDVDAPQPSLSISPDGRWVVVRSGSSATIRLQSLVDDTVLEFVVDGVRSVGSAIFIPETFAVDS